MTVVNKKSRNSTSSKKPRSSSKKIQKKKDVSQPKIVVLSDIVASDVFLHHYGEPEEEQTPGDEEIQETIIDFGNEDVGIVDLLHEKSKKSKRSIMFLDPHKGQVKFWGIMIDMTANGPLPRYTPKPCWWCRNKFSYHPIGCPVRYNNHKDKGLDKERIEERIAELNISLENGNDFFETEGIFCTFPCVKAYILDQISKTKSPKYKKALTLLTLLYLKLVGVVITIPAAASWKLTTDWGGHMSPHEFRASTGLLEYTETVNTLRPYMFCSSNWIREKRVRQ